MGYKHTKSVRLLIFFFICCIFYMQSIYANSPNEPNDLTQQKGRYPFKAGDAIRIDTFPDTTSFLHNRIFPINDQGFVDFPIVEHINVVKMSTIELVVFLKDTYKSYLRSPNITVRPVIRISLLGGFVRPGLYYIDIDKSLWEAVRLSGGPVFEEGIYDMKWERNGDEQKGDLTYYFESGVSLKRMGFQSGDQIWTPSPDARTFWDTVNNFLPFITLATTITLAYMTYQQSVLQIQYRR